MLFVHALWYYEGQVSAPHPSLVPGFMPDENAIGPGQSTYQILFYSFDQFIKYFGVYLVVDEK